jgi:hypothetical protein
MNADQIGVHLRKSAAELFYGIAGVNPCACSTGDVEEVGKTMFL